MNPHLLWPNLMQMLREVENRNGYAKLDQTSKRVLEWITCHPPGRPIYVQAIIEKCGAASPATTHKSLYILKTEGLLSVEVDPADSRRRLVTLTSKAKELLKRMSREYSKGFKQLTQN